MSFKTNVVKREYKFLVKEKATGEEAIFHVNAESPEAAKLLVPETFEVIKEEE